MIVLGAVIVWTFLLTGLLVIVLPPGGQATAWCRSVQNENTIKMHQRFHLIHESAAWASTSEKIF